MLPLGWALAAISDVYYIIYADDITLWSVHNDLQRQESALQEALNAADEWCRCIGLTLSTDKTLYMSVANSWGRRRLVNTPIQLTLSGRPLTPAPQLRILGVVITANGSAKAWIREIKQQAHQVLHLIRRISSKAGVPRPTTTFRRHIEEADAALPTGSLVAYTDASCTDTQVVTSIVVPGHQNLCVNRLYLLRGPVPSVSAELLAIRDATKLVSAASASSSSFTIIRTHSTSAIKELRKKRRERARLNMEKAEAHDPSCDRDASNDALAILYVGLAGQGCVAKKRTGDGSGSSSTRKPVTRASREVTGRDLDPVGGALLGMQQAHIPITDLSCASPLEASRRTQPPVGHVGSLHRV
ncbi:hypothetical protein HPB52_009677 [Rhipicephalus sanguineus]|uniref:Reverse transcriptase domain-containing protein n=1 Tax=Rhipicephalus sanguineus TaxID=34632 RepID=A0A9D4PDB9_RHISA|nr:hypothetical protein HPB52_009677 [Rhipicephalus sanguineus]